MTPKEKAKELYNKFRNNNKDTVFNAKKCALIAVDEILKQCWDYRDIDLQASYEYWQKVKQEINKL